MAEGTEQVAGGEEAAAGEGEQGAGGAGIDFGPLIERFDSVDSRIQGIEERFQTSADAGEGEPPPELPPDLAQVMQELYGAGGELEEPAAAAAAAPTGPDPAAMAAAIKTQMEAATDPLRAELAELKITRDAERLEAQYPDLGTPEVAGPVMQEVHRIATALGNDAVMSNADIIEMVYLAQEQKKRAGAEVPAGEGGVHLEGSGSAASQEEGPSPQERIRAAGSQRKNTAFGF